MIESVEMVIRQPGFPDRVVALHEGATRLGRSEDNEVVLSDVGVSRRHSQVYWSGSECLIEDLGSGNGTYLRGQRIQSQPLADGDEVVIDPFVLTFRIRGATPAPAPAKDGPSPARLEVIVGTGMAGASYAITAKGLGIGRAEDRDVVLPDPAASRHHCQINVQNDRYTLKDLGSANGVYVNAVRVKEQLLDDGDIIRIGNTEMRFVRSSSVATDLTTQVNPALGPLPVSQGYTGQAIIPSSPPQPAYTSRPPAAARSSGSSIWLWLFGGVTVFGLMALLLLLTVLGIYAFAYESPPPVLVTRSVAWKLDLPGGLPGGSTDGTFNAGIEKMKQRDYRGALLDFYRVLDADPGSHMARKFALVAGEVVVLDHLGAHLAQESRERAEVNARRDLLIDRAKRGGKLGKAAEATLIEEFREDPVAIKAMNWEPTEAMVARAEAKKRAAAALSTEDYAAAAKDYELVLAGSTEADERIQALASLKTCRRELARQVSAEWSAAALAEGLGDAEGAAAAFERVKAVDPANPCARLQPR